MEEPKSSGLVDAHGREVKRGAEPCPRCGAPPTRRVRSAGFGTPHDVCGNCGQEFEELTT